MSYNFRIYQDKLKGRNSMDLSFIRGDTQYLIFKLPDEN